MNTIRKLAAGFLLLAGALHLFSAVLVKFNPTSIITIFFGFAYLVIGILLLRDGRTILWLGSIVPMVGMILAVIGLLIKPTLFGVLFIAIDIIIVTCCFFLIFNKK